jgi:alkane 1-monooxygenase
MKDLKYLFAYSVPLSAFISFESMGLGTYTSVIYAFIILPFLDLVTGNSPKNLSKEDENNKTVKRIFDVMLYLNLPIVFGLLWLVFTKIQTQE